CRAILDQYALTNPKSKKAIATWRTERLRRAETRLMQWLDKFTDHPASVGETYLEHMWTAAGFGTRLILAGAACLVHSLLPFLFKTTASREIASLHSRMIANRRKVPGCLDRESSPAGSVLRGRARTQCNGLLLGALAAIFSRGAS